MFVFRDLKSPLWLGFKAVLFVVLGTMAAGLLVLSAPTLQTMCLLLITIWAFCRAYFFLFCVIEKYIDPELRYSGFLTAIGFCLRSSIRSR